MSDSLFSFIKRPAEAEKPAPRAPEPQAAPAQAQQAPAPPPPPSANYEKLAARVAELEARLKAAEAPREKISELEGRLKALEASQGKISGLERASAGLSAGLQKAAADSERTAQELPKLRGELAVFRSRLEGIEETCRGLAMSGTESKRYLKDLEASLLGELKERFSLFDTAFGEIARKAGLAYDTAAAGVQRLDRVEERSLKLSHLENRLESDEKKLETLYAVDASVQALKNAMASLEGRLAALMKESACLSGERQRGLADLESLTHQVRQLSALFNHFRTELSFLLPKKKEKAGGER